jgi:sugar phosphate isomerase/epimerase
MYDRAIHTIALGRSSAGHTVDDKLRAAAEVGFRGIEMVFEDVQAEAVRMSTNRQAERGELGVEELVNASESIAKVGKELGLVVRSLQPFEQFEVSDERVWVEEVLILVPCRSRII